MRKIFYIFALVAFAFTSCDKNEELVNTISEAGNFTEQNQILSNYAKILAASLNNKDLRIMVKMKLKRGLMEITTF